MVLFLEAKPREPPSQARKAGIICDRVETHTGIRKAKEVVAPQQALMGGGSERIFTPQKTRETTENDAKRCSMTIDEMPAQNPLLRESAGHRIALARTLNP